VPCARPCVRDRPHARRRARGALTLVRERWHARRPSEPAPPGAAQRVPDVARTHALAPRRPHDAVRGGSARALRHRARGALRHPGAVGRARALPRDRARNERERVDAVRGAARGRPDGQPPQDARGRGLARGAGDLRAALGVARRRAPEPRGCGSGAGARGPARGRGGAGGRSRADVPDHRRRPEDGSQGGPAPAARARSRRWGWPR